MLWACQLDKTLNHSAHGSFSPTYLQHRLAFDFVMSLFTLRFSFEYAYLEVVSIL
jgi:hypothetical protein